MISWGLSRARRSGLPVREDHEMFAVTDQKAGIHLVVRKPQAGYAIIGLQCRSIYEEFDREGMARRRMTPGAINPIQPVKGVVTELGLN